MAKKMFVLLAVLFYCLTFNLTQALAAAGEVIVAKSGGNYTTIQAAIDAINPSASNPYVIKVMPGTYEENISLKSYISLQGSGREVTTIQSYYGWGIYLYSLTNVSISGFRIQNAYSSAIYNWNSTPLVIQDNQISGYNTGIVNYGSLPATIKGNTIYVQAGSGIESQNSASIITDNVFIGQGTGSGIYTSGAPLIMGNKISGANSGIFTFESSALVRENTVTGTNQGIVIHGYGSSGGAILHNKVTGNATDITVYVPSPNISFNTYDTIVGTAGVGMYNVKSDGTAAPNP